MSKDPSRLSISDALAALEKKHGKGTVMRLAKGQHVNDVDTLPTGVYSIDKALGGGIAVGRVTEIYGGEACGKTTFALQVVAQAQKAGKKAAYIDVEHAFNMQYAKTLGVDPEQLYFSQPDSAEQVFDIAKTLAQTGEFAIIIIDSVAALTPESDFESEVGKSQIGHLARFLAQSLKQVISIFAKTDTAVILINQMRMKMGVSYGDPYTTPGGMSLKYYASQRIRINKGSKIEGRDGEIIGWKSMFKIDKNKIAVPHQSAQVDFIVGKGFDAASDVFFAACREGIIRKDKATYYYKDEKLAVGELAAREAVQSNPEMFAKIVADIEDIRKRAESTTE